MPGTVVRIDIKANLASYANPGEFREFEKSLVLKLAPCKQGYLPTSKGKCKTCGPGLYAFDLKKG